jgi:hypothetical protein
MEVHHHPDLNHRRKKIREYFLEFLMIFLAVTLGFFAESLRENIGDKEKERDYISSLVGNLKQDSLLLNEVIDFNQRKLEGLDSIIALSFKDVNDPLNRQQLYKCSRYISFYSRFSSNDATMEQLKNSGGLRLIKHRHVADSIANYDMQMRAIYAAETPYAKAIDDALTASQGILVATWQMDSNYYRQGRFTDRLLPLLENDPKKIKIFFNVISDECGWTRNYINNLELRLPYTIRLIDFLQVEYGLEK